MEIFLELAKAWGPPGLLAIVLWWQLDKSEKRELSTKEQWREDLAVKDTRIQLLENKLTESYDERIAAAEQITTAMLKSAESSGALAESVHKLEEQIHRKGR